MSTVFVANTNMLELLGLRSEIEDEYIDDAAVSVTIKTKAGVEVSGVTWPLTMAYVAASDGDYRTILSEDLAFVAKADYIAYIEADGGAGRVGHWELPFKAQTRTG
jgi:hypothetical protein